MTARHIADQASPSLLRIETIGQPGQGSVVDLLASATRQQEFRRLRAAVAYATPSGIQLLKNAGACQAAHLTSEWLVAVDWCRSEPAALDALESSRRSTVRIPSGAHVINSPRCTPRTPFHPKGFLFLGPKRRLLVSGSANLSRNGLSRGHELDTVIEVRNAKTSAEKKAWKALGRTNKWFRELWRDSTAYPLIANDYRTAHAGSIKEPVPTSDDVTESTGRRPRTGFSGDDLLKLRSAQHLWIEAGNVSQNRGRGVPGNQIMMRAMTRVFFGVEPRDVSRDTHLITLAMSYQGHISWDRTLRYSNNSMDVLTVPVPGSPTGPPSYDNLTLVLRKASHNGALIYELRIATPAETVSLGRYSDQVGGRFVMSSGRQFGVY